MKEKKIYITEDGKEFASRKTAEKHEFNLFLESKKITEEELRDFVNTAEHRKIRLLNNNGVFSDLPKMYSVTPSLVEELVKMCQNRSKFEIIVIVKDKEVEKVKIDTGKKDKEKEINKIAQKYTEFLEIERINGYQSTTLKFKEKELTILEKLEKGIELDSDEISDFLWNNKEIYEEKGDNNRWTRYMLTVVEDEKGNKWAIEWQQGLTEYQEHVFDYQPYRVELQTREVITVVTDVLEVITKEEFHKIRQEVMQNGKEIKKWGFPAWELDDKIAYTSNEGYIIGLQLGNMTYEEYDINKPLRIIRNNKK